MISERLKELIRQAEMHKAAQEFWEQVEKEAEEKNVDLQYYLAEFY